MNFDEIFEQWENYQKDKPTHLEKQEKNHWGDHCLDQFPPSLDNIKNKQEDYTPPVSQGRTNWNRRPHEDSLDLHGSTKQEAQISIEQFIQSMIQLGMRKGLIIHGKGHHSHNKPVLAPMVREYLKMSKEVGEFGQASHKDGGSGATWFVLHHRSR